MTLRDALEGLPDEAQVPVGWVREQLGEPEETPQDFDERQATIDMWVRRCTENYSGPGAWLTPGDGVPASEA